MNTLLMQSNVTGKKLLYHILKEKSWETFKDNQLIDSQFTGDAGQLLKYIRKYILEHNVFPTIEEVEDDLKIEFNHPIAKSAAVKRFKERLVEIDAGKALDEAQQHLHRKDQEKCYQSILKAKAAFSSSTKAILGFKEQAQDRYDQFLKDQHKPVRGIRPPLESWANNLIFENSTVNSLLGLSSVGKSYISGLCALHAAFVQGKKVLLVSVENSEQSMNERMDSMHFHLDYSGMRQKLFDFRAQERWESEIPDMQKLEGDVILVDAKRVKNIHDVMGLQSQLETDFVIVDGHYKLAGVDFRDSSALLNDTCSYATDSGVPWLITSQLNIEVNQHTGRAAGYSARGNKGYFIDVRTTTNMTQTKELELLGNVAKFEVTKNGEKADMSGISPTWYTQMDFKTTTISEFSLEDYDDQEIARITI